MLYTAVIIKQRSKAETLTYAVPAQIVPYIGVGSLVLVPVRNKILKGVVTELLSRVSGDLKTKIRPIDKLANRQPIISSKQIEVMKRLADHYCTSLAEVAFHALGPISSKILQSPPSMAGMAPFKPIFIRGTWSSRVGQYRRLIIHSSQERKWLIIFAQNSFAQDFYQLIKSDLGKAVVLYKSDTEISKQKAVEGSVRCIVTTAQGAFLPRRSDDVIIVDSPTQLGHFSNQRPFMSTAGIARIRAQSENLRLMYGDVLPSLELAKEILGRSITLAKQTSQIKPLTIISRTGSNQILQPTIVATVKKAIAQNKRVLLMVLAKGWASALYCLDCQSVIRCPNCQNVMSVGQEKLICQYCAHQSLKPTHCPICHKTNLKSVGEGASQVKSAVGDEIKQAKIVEISSNTDNRPDEGEIIVATEKIFSFPSWHFNLIILASIDRLLTNSQLNQVWKLYGYIRELQARSEQIMVQTYLPDHPIWSWLAHDNDWPFLKSELNTRQRLNLPPFGSIINLRGQLRSQRQLDQEKNTVVELIGKILPKASIGEWKLSIAESSYNVETAIMLTSQPIRSKLKELAVQLPLAWHLVVDQTA